MMQLNGKYDEYVNTYRESEAEALLCKELGVWKQTVMSLAVAKPGIASLDAHTQVKPAIRALKDANIAPEDIWFLVTRQWQLLSLPAGTLQRWLDFLTVYGLTPANLQNFLLRCGTDLLEHTTVYQAGCVVQYLKGPLGIKDEFLATRVLSVWPQVLSRDVERHLKPVVAFLMRIGVEVSDVRGIVCAWPELLMCDVEQQLQPWVDFLRTRLGCSTAQAGDIIALTPHLLGFPAADVYRGHLAALDRLGISELADLRRMCDESTSWLTTPGGIAAQVEFLVGPAGFTPAQARELVLAAPQLLSEKEFELQRKWSWLQGHGVQHQDVLACPEAMGLGLMRVLGPRHGFLDKAGQVGDGKLDLRLLAVPRDDVDWTVARGVPALDYARYRAHWEEEWNQGLVRSAAQEFQDELKKLGIYEGTD